MARQEGAHPLPLTRLRRFVERTASPRYIAVARIGVGLVAAARILERGATLARLSEPGVIRVPYLEGAPSIADLPVLAILVAGVGLAAAFSAGLFTWVTGSALFLLLGSILLSDQQLYANNLYLLTLLVGLLTLAGSGAALSLDARRGRGRQAVPVWPIVLLRLQISAMYLFTAIAKVNLEFLSGSSLFSTLRREGPLAIPEGWRTFDAMAAASVLAVIVELLLAFWLWSPRRRATAIAIGVAMHAAIAVWIAPTLGLVLFALLMFAVYPVFLDDRRGP